MRNLFFYLLVFLFVRCSTTAPRRPLNPKPSTTIFQDNIKATKKLFKLEEMAILQFIKKDSTRSYRTSSNGFWYAYNKKTEQETASPKAGDVVEFEYDIRTLYDTIVYSKEALGVRKYNVDKEDFISGIQKGIKLMKIGETITFVIPSYNAFGVSGDGNKIKRNQTIKSTVTLININ